MRKGKDPGNDSVISTIDRLQLITYLKSKLRTENEQMSVPLPQIPVKIPPMKPVKIRMAACQTPKFGMES